MKRSFLSAAVLLALLAGPSAALEARGGSCSGAAPQGAGGVVATPAGRCSGPICLHNQIRRCFTIGSRCICTCGSFFQIVPG